MSSVSKSFFVCIALLLSTASGPVCAAGHGISTREAKSFYIEMRRNPYSMTNDLEPNYFNGRDVEFRRKEDFGEDGKKKSFWMSRPMVRENSRVLENDSANGRDEPSENFWIADFGDAEKVITVRISSSVEGPVFFRDGAKGVKGKASGIGEAAVPRGDGFDGGMEIGFGGSSNPGFRDPDVRNDVSAGRVTESPRKDDPLKSYYETRIESVSSRKEVVFGKPSHEESPARTPSFGYDFHRREGEPCCRLPDGNYGSTDLDGEALSVPKEAERKSSYLTDDRNFRKYRVEERTPDGFIVGEYGFVGLEDGNVHGVRYTADVAANPRLIYEALLKFLSL